MRKAFALIFTGFTAMAALATPVFGQDEHATAIPVDGDKMVGGIDVGCTGIGESRLQPRWREFPVRVEFSNAKNVYLVGAVVSVSDAKGQPLASASCDDSWVLFKLPPGDYRLQARLTDSSAKPRGVPFKAPKSGQIRVVVQFPDATDQD